jgi:hypothetical protein
MRIPVAGGLAHRDTRAGETGSNLVGLKSMHSAMSACGMIISSLCPKLFLPTLLDWLMDVLLLPGPTTSSSLYCEQQPPDLQLDYIASEHTFRHS